MERLNLPTYSFNLKCEGTTSLIFDSFRNRWVTLTPEEWVRQNFAEFLVTVYGYPRSLILIEQEIRLNRLSRRCDIVAYNRKGQPVLLVECKAPEVAVNQKVFEQAARYNLVLGVRNLIITNGLVHYCLILNTESGSWDFASEIPQFPEEGCHSS